MEFLYKPNISDSDISYVVERSCYKIKKNNKNDFFIVGKRETTVRCQNLKWFQGPLHYCIYNRKFKFQCINHFLI